MMNFLQSLWDLVVTVFDWFISTIQNTAGLLVVGLTSADQANKFIDNNLVPHFAITLCGAALSILMIKVILGRDN